MRRVHVDEALGALQRHQAAGLHVDSRLIRQVQAPGQMYALSLPDAAAFLALIWQSTNDTRPLAPVQQPRTLIGCASRLAAFEWRFENLAQAGYPWFGKCETIDTDFDRSSFGQLALTPCTVSERHASPGGTYYIYDGVHKSIVLAKKLFRREIEYEPVEALLLTPRRS